jgi:hypothetical protein
MIAAWWNFFYMCGSSAAALMGLMFVAVTLGWRLIKKETIALTHVFLTAIVFHFLQVLFLCCLTAVPVESPLLLAAGAAGSAVIRLVGIPAICRRLRAESERVDITRSDWFNIVLMPSAVYLALIASGAGLYLGALWAVPLLAGSCLVMVLGAAYGAWDMLIWIATTLES